MALAAIDRVGWHCRQVANRSGPGWSCTVGLWHGLGAPEVVVFGFPAGLRRDCLEAVVEGLGHGRTVDANQFDTTIFEFPVAFRSVDRTWTAALLGPLAPLAPDPCPMLQLVWPDPDGRMPWDPGFDAAFVDQQPSTWRPRPTDWVSPPPDPWPASVEVVCITLPWVVDGRAQATYASRHFDDVWQVLDDPDVEGLEDEAVVVRLGELVELDPSLVELRQLAQGWEARRRHAGAPWEIGPQADPD